MLVVLTLQYMSDTVVHALQPLLQQARMPQWPLHCAVGIVDKHKADAAAAKLASALQGTVFSLQPESIRELVATQPAADACHGGINKHKSSGAKWVRTSNDIEKQEDYHPARGSSEDEGDGKILKMKLSEEDSHDDRRRWPEPTNITLLVASTAPSVVHINES
jgi:hypothetical protein